MIDIYYKDNKKLENTIKIRKKEKKENKTCLNLHVKIKLLKIRLNYTYLIISSKMYDQLV